MKTILVCKHCGSPRVQRDAYVSLNDPEEVQTFDYVMCPDCGVESKHVHNLTVERQVPDDFDINDWEAT